MKTILKTPLELAFILLVALQLQACGGGATDSQSNDSTKIALADENTEGTPIVQTSYNTTKAETTPTVYEPCKNNGSVKIAEGHSAYTSYKNALKQIESAKKMMKMGGMDAAQNNVKNIKRYIDYVLKKEPKADISELCNELSQLEGKTSSVQNDKEMFNKAYYVLNKYYSMPGMPAMPQQFNFLMGQFLEETKDFDRNALLAGAASSPDPRAKQVQQRLEDYSAFIDRGNIAEYLNSLIDEQKDASVVLLSERANKVKEIANRLKDMAGGNENLESVIAYADRQLEKAGASMANIYTSDFHRDHVHQIVFTKKPLQIGNEQNAEINPVFKVGDAIYATVYLSAPISELNKQWTRSRGSSGARLMDMDLFKAGTLDRLQHTFESWEVNNHLEDAITVLPSISSQTYIQFVLLPNMNSNVSAELKSYNITPIFTARAISQLPERKQSIDVVAQQATGLDCKGTFTIDLASGEGKKYYQNVDNKLIDELISSNPLPTASIKNASLEAQLLAEMNSQGWKETFKKAYINSDWEAVTERGKVVYRRMRASFTYTTPDGKCGSVMYTFRSLPTGSGGWGKPTKWGGADARERLSCNKIK